MRFHLRKSSRRWLNPSYGLKSDLLLRSKDLHWAAVAVSLQR